MTWRKGQSGNPRGRPKGSGRVAKMISEATDGYREMVDYALEIWRDTTADPRDRQWAFQWLSDRGLGKPMQQIDLQANIEAEVRPRRLDFSHLSREELAEAERLFLRLNDPKLLPPGDE